MEKLTKCVREALQKEGFLTLTNTQEAALPAALQKKDLLCRAQTGSGKTLAYLIPLLTMLLEEKETGAQALVLVPTRQLVQQVQEMYRRVAKHTPLHDRKLALLYGGQDQMHQVVQLARRPQILVGTPGRTLQHLNGTKGFRLERLSFLVLDQVDALTSYEHLHSLEQLLRILNEQAQGKTRQTLMFSATVSPRVMRLEKLACRKATLVEVSDCYSVPSKLQQFQFVIRCKYRDALLYLLLKDSTVNQRSIVFCDVCETADRLCRLLEMLGVKAVSLHGKLIQDERQEAALRFKEEGGVLVTTDVAARGLDFQDVTLVVNYDVPDPMNYVHRVGRTARNGRSGTASTIVTEHAVETAAILREKVQGICSGTYSDEKVKMQYEKVTKANQKARPPRRL